MVQPTLPPKHCFSTTNMIRPLILSITRLLTRVSNNISSSTCFCKQTNFSTKHYSSHTKSELYNTDFSLTQLLTWHVNKTAFNGFLLPNKPTIKTQTFLQSLINCHPLTRFSSPIKSKFTYTLSSHH